MAYLQVQGWRVDRKFWQDFLNKQSNRKRLLLEIAYTDSPWLLTDWKLTYEEHYQLLNISLLNKIPKLLDYYQRQDLPLLQRYRLVAEHLRYSNWDAVSWLLEKPFPGYFALLLNLKEDLPRFKALLVSNQLKKLNSSQLQRLITEVDGRPFLAALYEKLRALKVGSHYLRQIVIRYNRN